MEDYIIFDVNFLYRIFIKKFVERGVLFQDFRLPNFFEGLDLPLNRFKTTPHYNDKDVLSIIVEVPKTTWEVKEDGSYMTGSELAKDLKETFVYVSNIIANNGICLNIEEINDVMPKVEVKYKVTNEHYTKEQGQKEFKLLMELGGI